MDKKWKYGLKLHVQLLFAFNRDLLSAILDFSKLSRKHVFTTQILQISQIDCRNRRYRAITQIRDSEPPSQKSQILQISQIDCRNPRHRGITQIETQNPHRRNRRYCNIADILQKSQNYSNERLRTHIADIATTADIANIADELQKLQISQNYSNERLIYLRHLQWGCFQSELLQS